MGWAGTNAPPNPAIVPTERLNEPWWAARHEAVLQAVREHADAQLVLIGDSITNNYDKANPPDENFQPTWREFYEPRKALNLGFSGDRTEHVLWRIKHGELNGLHPKAVVLLIGTNNTGHRHTAEQTVAGIDGVIAAIEARLPETHILLLGVLPSGISAAKTAADREINARLAQNYGVHPRVTYLDISSIFYKDGQLDSSIFYDSRLKRPGAPLHPDTVGQRRMAEAIEPALARLMGEAPRVKLTAMTDINTALIPVPWLEQDSYEWYARHNAVVAVQAKLAPRVVMIGDSITHYWGGVPAAANNVTGPESWQRLFGSTPVLNMGFGWDRTQNVLWRLRQGEFAGLHPGWVVLMIGTNNLSGTSHARANTPAEIVEGIAAIIDELKVRSPQSRILLMQILPRGHRPGDAARAPIAETNRLIREHFTGQAGVTLVDAGRRFLQPDGTLPKELMYDGTHPTEAGYALWAEELIQAGLRP